MAEHTLTPWSVLPDEFGNPTYIVGPADHAVAECCFGYGIEDDANAALIIKAVNSHEALLKAAKALVEEIATSGTHQRWKRLADVIHDAVGGEKQ